MVVAKFLSPPKLKSEYATVYPSGEVQGKLTFKEHAKWTATKVERVVTSINQLMSNLGGLSESISY